jgi:hypothetical protein
MSVEAPAAMRVPLSVQLSEAQLVLAKTLTDSVDAGDWVFKAPEGADPANAPVFAYVAATSEKPEVIAAALLAMTRAEQRTKGASPGLSREDFEAVVSYGLSSTFPRLQGRGLAAVSETLRRNPNSKLADAALAMLPKLSTAGGQHDLLETLSLLPDQRKRAALEKFLPLMPQLEAVVAARVFADLAATARSVPAPPALISTGIEGLGHSSEFVRGRASEFLGQAGKGHPGAEQALLDLLSKEKSPFVLAVTAEALQRLRSRPAIHKIVKLLDDDRSTRVEAPPWKTLDQKVGRQIYGGPSAKRTVSMVAFATLAGLSDGALKPAPPEPSDKDAGHDRNTKAAKAWYAKVKGDVPKTIPTAAAVLPASAPGKSPAPSPTH